MRDAEMKILRGICKNIAVGVELCYNFYDNSHFDVTFFTEAVLYW